MIDENPQTEFFKRFIGTSQVQRSVFTPEIVNQIGDDFDIPVEKRNEVGQLLEVGALQWARETRRAALDFEQIRKELRSLEKAAKAILTAVETLSADTQEMMIEAGIGRTLGGVPLPRLSGQETAPVLEYAATHTDEGQCISLSEARLILAALGQCASDAQPMARASRKGRPEQEGLFDLLHFGFHVWASVLGRAFKLDWAPDGHPITDAASFSVRITHVVAPSLPLQQIATAARKVREKAMSIRNLEKMPEVMEHYRKQFE